MRIDKFLNQTVTWKKRLDNDDYGEYIYDEPIILPARIERKTQIVEKSGGSITRASNIIFLNVEVFPGDLINEHEVLTVSDYVDRMGNIQGFEVTT